jgi:hypothetical protein
MEAKWQTSLQKFIKTKFLLTNQRLVQACNMHIKYTTSVHEYKYFLIWSKSNSFNFNHEYLKIYNIYLNINDVVIFIVKSTVIISDLLYLNTLFLEIFLVKLQKE